MKGFCSVTLIGNLTSDPEIRQTKNGSNVANFALAVNRVGKSEDGNKLEVADFHRIVAWNGLAGICEKYFKKGMPVFVSGRLVNNSYDDSNGVKQYRTEVLADSLLMLGSKVTGQSLVAA